jgi:hypothetical protein
MPDESLRQQLVGLFQETGSAHHLTYAKTNGADDEWPLWYASYMQDKLNALFKPSLTKSKIVQLLVSASEEYEAGHASVDWTEYYADFFIKQLQ